MSDSLSNPKISEGLRLATDLKLQGTPAILINGYMYFGAPPDSVLEAALTRAVSGKPIGTEDL